MSAVNFLRVSLLTDPQVLTAIQSRQVTSTEVMKDIDGGRLYKKMKDFTSKVASS